VRKSIVTVFQDIACSLDEGVKTDEIIKEFSKSFYLVPHYRLLTKIEVTGEDFRVVVRAVLISP
jgi:transposase